MKHYYLHEGTFYVGAKCPNCLQEFNLVNRDTIEEEFKVKDDVVKILFCGHCTIDREHVQEKIDMGVIQLKEMETRNLEVRETDDKV